MVREGSARSATARPANRPSTGNRHDVAASVNAANSAGRANGARMRRHSSVVDGGWSRMGSVPDEGIYLEQMELGPMQNFVYLVGDPVARECVVVDPAWEIETIIDTARADGMRLTGALVTHTHQDHVGGSLASWGMPGRIPGVEELLARVPLQVYVHK